MTAQAELERTMARWLTDEASTAGRDRVLAAALARVAVSDQERFLAQRVLGDRLGRVSAVRRALAIGLAAALVAGAAAIAGSLLREAPPVPPAGRANGAVSYTADGDVYLVEPGVAAHRIVGADGDGSDAGCLAFSVDGARLAYVEARSPWDTAPSWSTVVSAVDAHGAPQGSPSRIQIAGSLTTCPAWSSNLQRLAYVRPAFEGGDLVVIDVARDGRQVVRVPGPGNGAVPPASDFSLGPLAWSPDGERLAYVRASGPNLQQSEIRVLGILSGGAPILGAPAEADPIVNTVAWSPDGERLVVASTDVPRATTAGT